MRKDRLGPLVQKPISNSRLVWFGLDREQSSFFPRISLLRRSSFGGETARKRGKERENGEIKKSAVGDDGLPRALFPISLFPSLPERRKKPLRRRGLSDRALPRGNVFIMQIRASSLTRLSSRKSKGLLAV